MDSANQPRPGAGRRARPTRAGRRGLPLLLLLGVALLWRLMFLLAIHDTPAGQWHQWDQSDMHTYLMQGRQLAAGDWLAREPYYPYHLWMSAGSPAAWRALYPPHVFHQAPLLSYGLALFLRFGVDPVPWIRLLHAVLGLINTYLLYRLGRLLGGRVAGLVAGLFGALYGPLLVIESQPLREPAALALTLLALLCVAAMPIRRKGGRERTRALAFGAGFATGVLALLHEAAAVVLLSAALALAWDGLVVRRAPRRFAACLALLLGGALIGFLPLLARNLAVGAPPFAQSTRSALTWAMANHPDAPWGGVRWTGPDASFFETLEGTRGRPLRVVIRTLAAYEGAPWRWALNWGRRALALEADFSDVAAARGVVRDAVSGLGGVDIVVCSAAMLLRKPALETSDAEWQRLHTINLHSSFAIAQEAARDMVPRGVGRIVIVSSVNQWTPNPGLVAYAASKAGVMQMARTMALELAPTGV
ncbi:MAG TPA: SDR family NAD(P)-dependent oxidoreductase, partial [Candidatus Sumerlaeota bacterium]|nr:SDR family NAD(P)-dependent oxidoreductase [Candidatus Sumerlaeota bacterium]